MMAEQTLTALGRVEKVEEGHAYLRTQRETGCSGCQGSSSCGTSVLSKWFAEGSSPLLKLPNSLNTRPGDLVELAMPSQDLSRQALYAYGIPLFGFMFGASVSMWLFDSEPATIGGGLLGLVIGLVLLKKYHRVTLPQMVKILSD